MHPLVMANETGIVRGSNQVSSLACGVRSRGLAKGHSVTDLEKRAIVGESPYARSYPDSTFACFLSHALWKWCVNLVVVLIIDSSF